MGTKSSATERFNKSAFVRGLGPTPAADVVALAKQHGHTISLAYVYNIRSTQKKRAKGKPGAKRAVLESVGAVAPLGPKPPARKPPAPVRSALRINLDAIAMQFVDQVLETLRHASMRDISEA